MWSCYDGSFALGAEGVQVGSRFVASMESSAHTNFKEKVINTAEGQTVLTLKQLTPVRLIKNKFAQDVEQAQQRCATREELTQLLGRARAKKGMFEGDLDEGELEIGQVAATIKEILPAGEIVKSIWQEFTEEKNRITKLF